jgi:Fe-S cluster biosynthesis and repair protein YggX
MSRMVKCVKLGREAPGLDYQTYPGELGKRIFENVSKEAWQLWMSHQTMLINENRLNPLDPKARKFIEGEMEKFFFGEGSELPAGYVPPTINKYNPAPKKTRPVTPGVFFGWVYPITGNCYRECCRLPTALEYPAERAACRQNTWRPAGCRNRPPAGDEKYGP